jgi:predicted nucleic-acid-binding protein
MPAIDTNVLVRFLTADDPQQYKASHKLFASENIFIADSVVLESEWVLRAAYDLSPAQICDGFRRVFGLPNVSLAHANRVTQALAWHEQGLDFADAFHLAQCQDHTSLKTFDATFIKRAKNLSKCLVEKA